MIEWLTLRIREAPFSYHGNEKESWFSSVPIAKFPDNVSNQGTTPTFGLLSYFLLTNHPIIRRSAYLVVLVLSTGSVIE
jgi:hypothetical protein